MVTIKNKHPENMVELSVVLISKNQEWNITRLVESVLKNSSFVNLKDILLVDSASTDKTIQLASNYPIKIIRLHSGEHLTPAAGRYIGYGQSEGEFILFLDGDMELCPGWLEQALDYIKKQPEVAAVSGERINLPKTARQSAKTQQFSTDKVEAIEIKQPGGAALYRRSVMRDVGPFNPYFYSDEEPDLCFRIRNAGHKIIQLGQPIIYHYSDPTLSVTTKFRRWKRKLYLGSGQVLRYHFGKKIFWQLLIERSYGIIPLFGLSTGFSFLLWYLRSGEIFLLQLWLLVVALLLFIDACRKQSLYKTMVSLLERLFLAEGTLRGFFKKSCHPEQYPGRFDRIK